MLDNSRTLDDVAKLEWPGAWELKQRELTQVIWTAPEEEFKTYAEFKETSTPSCLLPVCVCVVAFMPLVYSLLFIACVCNCLICFWYASCCVQ